MPNPLDDLLAEVPPAEAAPAAPSFDARKAISEAAKKYGVDEALAQRVATQESAYDPKAVSPKGAIGVMQLMPGTAKDLGVDPFDPGQNVDGGVRYLRQMLDRYSGDVPKALAAYNAGPARVDSGRPLPRETEDYVKTVGPDPLDSLLGDVPKAGTAQSADSELDQLLGDVPAAKPSPFGPNGPSQTAATPQAPVVGMEKLGGVPPGPPKPPQLVNTLNMPGILPERYSTPVPVFENTPGHDSGRRMPGAEQVRARQEQMPGGVEGAENRLSAAEEKFGSARNGLPGASSVGETLMTALPPAAEAAGTATAVNATARQAFSFLDAALSTYFTYQSAKGAKDSVIEAKKAFDEGDYAGMVRQLGTAGIEAAFAYWAGNNFKGRLQEAANIQKMRRILQDRLNVQAAVEKMQDPGAPRLTQPQAQIAGPEGSSPETPPPPAAPGGGPKYAKGDTVDTPNGKYEITNVGAKRYRARPVDGGPEVSLPHAVFEENASPSVPPAPHAGETQGEEGPRIVDRSGEKMPPMGQGGVWQQPDEFATDTNSPTARGSEPEDTATPVDTKPVAESQSPSGLTQKLTPEQIETGRRIGVALGAPSNIAEAQSIDLYRTAAASAARQGISLEEMLHQVYPEHFPAPTAPVSYDTGGDTAPALTTPTTPTKPTGKGGEVARVGEMAAGLTDSMYDNLWSKVQKGDTTEAGGPSTLLQAAKMVRDRGGLQSIDEFKKFAQGYANVPRDGGFQQSMRDLVAKYSPAAEPEKHEYASTQVNMPADVSAAAAKFADGIPARHLSTEEETPRQPADDIHATALYGLHADNADQVRDLLKDQGPITVTLGKASVFPASEAGGSDVLKVDVHSADLHKVNALLRQLPHTNKYPEFKPHVTLAYLRPGDGKHYDGQEIPGVTGKTVTLNSLTFSGKDGKQISIPLKGKPGADTAQKGSTAKPGTLGAALPPSQPDEDDDDIVAQATQQLQQKRGETKPEAKDSARTVFAPEGTLKAVAEYRRGKALPGPIKEGDWVEWWNDHDGWQQSKVIDVVKKGFGDYPAGSLHVNSTHLKPGQAQKIEEPDHAPHPYRREPAAPYEGGMRLAAQWNKPTEPLIKEFETLINARPDLLKPSGSAGHWYVEVPGGDRAKQTDRIDFGTYAPHPFTPKHYLTPTDNLTSETGIPYGQIKDKQLQILGYGHGWGSTTSKVEAEKALRKVMIAAANEKPKAEKPAAENDDEKQVVKRLEDSLSALEKAAESGKLAETDLAPHRSAMKAGDRLLSKLGKSAPTSLFRLVHEVNRHLLMVKPAAKPAAKPEVSFPGIDDDEIVRLASEQFGKEMGLNLKAATTKPLPTKTAPTKADVAMKAVAHSDAMERLDAAADAAMAKLEAMMAEDEAADKPDYEREEQPIDPRYLVQLAVVGARHIAKGAEGYDAWAAALESEAGKVIAHVAKRSGNSTDDVLQKIHGYAVKVAGQYGFEMKPAAAAGSQNENQAKPATKAGIRGKLPTGTFMNRWDVDMAVDRFKKHPVLSRATKFLQDLRDETDAHSDGWAYWKAPLHAAGQLMGIIQHPEWATEENFQRALAPIKSFYTKRGKDAGMKWPTIAPVPENASTEIPPAHSYVTPITKPLVSKPAAAENEPDDDLNEDEREAIANRFKGDSPGVTREMLDEAAEEREASETAYSEATSGRLSREEMQAAIERADEYLAEMKAQKLTPKEGHDKGEALRTDIENLRHDLYWVKSGRDHVEQSLRIQDAIEAKEAKEQEQALPPAVGFGDDVQWKDEDGETRKGTVLKVEDGVPQIVPTDHHPGDELGKLYGIPADQLTVTERRSAGRSPAEVKAYQEKRNKEYFDELKQVPVDEKEYQRVKESLSDADTGRPKQINRMDFERVVGPPSYGDEGQKQAAIYARLMNEGLIEPAKAAMWMSPRYTVKVDPRPETLVPLIESFRRAWLHSKDVEVPRTEKEYDALKAKAETTKVGQKRLNRARLAADGAKRWEYINRRHATEWEKVYERVTGKPYESDTAKPVGLREQKKPANVEAANRDRKAKIRSLQQEISSLQEETKGKRPPHGEVVTDENGYAKRTKWPSNFNNADRELQRKFDRLVAAKRELSELSRAQGVPYTTQPAAEPAPAEDLKAKLARMQTEGDALMKQLEASNAKGNSDEEKAERKKIRAAVRAHWDAMDAVRKEMGPDAGYESVTEAARREGKLPPRVIPPDWKERTEEYADILQRSLDNPGSVPQEEVTRATRAAVDLRLNLGPIGERGRPEADYWEGLVRPLMDEQLRRAAAAHAPVKVTPETKVWEMAPNQFLEHRREQALAIPQSQRNTFRPFEEWADTKVLLALDALDARQMQGILKVNGLPYSGTKDQMRKRIYENARFRKSLEGKTPEDLVAANDVEGLDKLLRFVGAPILGNKLQKAKAVLGTIASQRKQGEMDHAEANFKGAVQRAAAAGEPVPDAVFDRWGIPRPPKPPTKETPAFLSPDNAPDLRSALHEVQIDLDRARQLSAEVAEDAENDEPPAKGEPTHRAWEKIEDLGEKYGFVFRFDLQRHRSDAGYDPDEEIPEWSIKDGTREQAWEFDRKLPEELPNGIASWRDWLQEQLARGENGGLFVEQPTKQAAPKSDLYSDSVRAQAAKAKNPDVARILNAIAAHADAGKLPAALDKPVVIGTANQVEYLLTHYKPPKPVAAAERTAAARIYQEIGTAGLLDPNAFKAAKDAVHAIEQETRKKPQAPPDQPGTELSSEQPAPPAADYPKEGTAIIIPCAKTKMPGAVHQPAEEVYTGDYFKSNLAYAKAHGQKVFILSAKYGLITPGERISDYDLKFIPAPGATNNQVLDTVKAEKLVKQIEEHGLDKMDRWVVLGGKEYRGRIAEAQVVMRHQRNEDPNDDTENLSKLPEIITPTAGMGIGQAKQHVKQNTPKADTTQTSGVDPRQAELDEITARVAKLLERARIPSTPNRTKLIDEAQALNRRALELKQQIEADKAKQPAAPKVDPLASTILFNASQRIDGIIASAKRAIQGTPGNASIEITRLEKSLPEAREQLEKLTDAGESQRKLLQQSIADADKLIFDFKTKPQSQVLPPAAGPRSWKPQLQVQGEGDKWHDNALRFATKEEAEKAASDNFSRWMMATGHRAVESDEEPNYRWENGQAVHITAPAPAPAPETPASDDDDDIVAAATAALKEKRGETPVRKPGDNAANVEKAYQGLREWLTGSNRPKANGEYGIDPGSGYFDDVSGQEARDVLARLHKEGVLGDPVQTSAGPHYKFLKFDEQWPSKRAKSYALNIVNAQERHYASAYVRYQMGETGDPGSKGNGRDGMWSDVPQSRIDALRADVDSILAGGSPAETPVRKPERDDVRRLTPKAAPAPAPEPAPDNPLKAENDAARAKMRERMAAKRNADKPQYEREESKVSKEDLITLAKFGAEHMINGVSDFAEWRKQMLAEDGDFVNFVAEEAGQDPETFLRRIHSLARRVAGNFGVTVPEAPAETPAEPKAEDYSPTEVIPEAQKLITSFRGIINAIANHKGDVVDRDIISDNVKLMAHVKAVTGRSVAAGTIDTKQVYDLLETAINQEIAQTPRLMRGPVPESLAKLRDILSHLPTQAIRSDETVKFQQFSTPPTEALVAARVLAPTPHDLVAEPSGGTAGLASFARAAGAHVLVNEINPRRAELLGMSGYQDVTRFDGEQFDNVYDEFWDKYGDPTAVLMNPPFSAAGDRGVANSNEIGYRHVMQALRRLKPGGRLVAILGEGARLDLPNARDFFKKVREIATIRANVGIDGQEYAKYGTTFGNRIIVLDKVPTAAGPHEVRNGELVAKAPVTGEFKTLEAAWNALEPIANDRPAVQRLGDDSTDRGAGDREPADQRGSGESDREPRTGVRGQSGADSGRPAGDTAGAGATGAPGDDARVRPQQSEPAGSGAGGSRDSLETQAAEQDTPAPPSVEVRDQAVEAGEDVGDYVAYKPHTLPKEWGARPHEAVIVETQTMASVAEPPIWLKPNIPQEIIDKGELSDIQLATIAHTIQAHENFQPAPVDEKGKPDGEPKRLGFFNGDGTGVGKGRMNAGTAVHYWNTLPKGKRKIIWVSFNEELAEAARDDMDHVGGQKIPIYSLEKVQPHKKLAFDDGVLFVPYSKLATQQVTKADGTKFEKGATKEERGKGQKVMRRLQQLMDWAGEEPVIMFDEAHKAKNATAAEKNIGDEGRKAKAKPTLTGLAVIELQNQRPKARVVYTSATGFSDVSNMAYATRLGIWGPGTSFKNFEDFRRQVDEGGIGVMEIVAQNLKAQGKYLSRFISYSGVKFDETTHDISPEQHSMLDRAGEAWRKVIKNFRAAAAETTANTGGEKGPDPQAQARILSQAMSQLWSQELRFYSSLYTAMKVPTLIKIIDDALTPTEEHPEGKAVVISVRETGQAQQDRELARLSKEGIDDLEEADVSPVASLLNLVENNFPTIEYETVKDPETGEDITKVKMITDPKTGEVKPAQSAEALRMKKALLEDLNKLKGEFPDSALDQIINKYGSANVAEMTKRGERLVRDPNTGERIVESRGSDLTKTNLAEMAAFQGGRKKIALISNAASTGISLHSSVRAQNQLQRVHVMLQLKWSADMTMQDLGRTHRTAQVIPPHYILLSLDVEGEKRFAATVARRLEQLGALSRGERKAGSGGTDFSKYNFESKYGRYAIDQVIDTLYFGADKYGRLNQDEMKKYPALADGRHVLEMMGLYDPDKAEDKEDESSPDVPVNRFFNRLMILPIDMQNQLFRLFMQTMEAHIEHAKRIGTFDAGAEKIKAAHLDVAENPIVVFEDPATKAQAVFYKLTARNPRPRITYAEMLEESRNWRGPVSIYRVKSSGRLLAVHDETRKETDYDTGKQTERHTYISAAGTGSTLRHEELTDKNGKYEKVDKSAGTRAQWDEQYEAAGQWMTHNEHLITGTVLPIWNKIQERRGEGRGSHALPVKVKIAQLDNGKRLIGAQVEPQRVRDVLKALGHTPVVKPEDVMKGVLRGKKFNLMQGATLKRSKVSGEDRIEIEGAYHFQRLFPQWGLYSEQIRSGQTRWFIPTGEKGLPVLQRVLKELPIRAAEDEEGNATPDYQREETGPHGPIYRQYRHKAQEALARLWAEGTGDAIAALHHPEVGDIDLTADIAAKLRDNHPEVIDDLQGFISKLGKISESANRIILASPGRQQRAAVRLDYDGKAKRWLLTAYDREARRLTRETTDAPGTLASEGTVAPSSRSNSNIAPDEKKDKPDYEREAPGFYSQLERTIDAKMPSKAPVPQVLAILDNPGNGVKPAEVKWSGVKGWLVKQKGSVTKQEVLDYLKANDVQVQEVMKPDTPEVERQRQELEARVDDLSRQMAEAARDGDDERRNELWRQRDEAAKQLAGAPRQAATKYGEYTLPGGQNYRELLLTLPTRHSTPVTWSDPETKQIRSRNGFGPVITTREWTASDDAYILEDPERGFVINSTLVQNAAQPTLAKAMAFYQEQKWAAEEQYRNASALVGNYTSPHWSERNVLAHVRFDGRTANGGKILHVAEIQSDWHQAGRKHGYGEPSAPRGWANTDGSDKVPAAPFEKTWHELAFKRMLRYAAEHGYDKLTWDTGKTAADRFDLSKHVDQVRYIDHGDGTYDVWAADKHGASLSDSLDKQRITPDQIEQFVGKEVAQRIIDGKGQLAEDEPTGEKVLSGLDLKVGGEGMAAFYDQILPAFANKYAKKWGAKVETTEVSGKIKGAADPKRFGRRDLGRMGVLLDEEDNLGFDTNKQARDAIAKTPDWEQRWEVTNPELRDLLRKYRAARTEIVPAHSIEITPAMRKSVMEGQPLFERKPGEPAASAIAVRVRNGKVFGNQAALDALAGVWGDRNIGGMNLEPSHVAKAVATLGTDPANADLVAALKQAAAQSPTGEVSVEKYGQPLSAAKATARHEAMHQAQNQLSDHLGRLESTFLNHPLAQKAAEQLAGRGYREKEMAREIGAHLAAGQYERLGLNRDEWKRLFFHYINLLHTLHGAKLEAAIRNIAPALQETFRRATQETDTDNPGDRAEPTRGGGGGEEGPQSLRRGVRPDRPTYESEGAGGEPDRGRRQARDVAGLDRPPSAESTSQLRDADEQRVREAVLRRLAADPEGYLSRYTTRFGNVLNADDAATLFDEYKADPAKYRVAVHPAAVWVRDELFRRALATPSSAGEDQVFFTAGSNAAGKSTAIRHANANRGALAVLDTTFSNLAHSRRLLAQALDAGKAAHIVYVRRPLAAAFEGMLNRAEEEGRVVSIAQMINSDSGAAAVIRELAREYGSDPRVTFTHIDNGANPHEAGIELAAPRDYTEVREQLHDILEAAHKSGRLTEANFRRIAGNSRPDAPQASREPSDQQPERSGLRRFLKDETGTSTVAQSAKAVAEALAGARADVLKLLAPAAVDADSRSAAMVARYRAADLARSTARAEKALDATQKFFNSLPKDERLDFIDRMENGRSQPTPELNLIAVTLRRILDGRREAVQKLGTGKLETWIENYFPHIWKRPEKAREAFLNYAKRPMEGSKAFLKRRKIPTLQEGIDLGLEPESTNPVDLVLAKVREMDKYIMAHRVLNDLKDRKLLQYVRAEQPRPAGYKEIDDKVATVFGPRFGAVRLPEGVEEETGLRPEHVRVYGMRVMGRYMAPEPVARVINNYLSPGLRSKSATYRGWSGLANLMNNFTLGFSAFHLGFTSVDAATSGLALGIYQLAHGKPLDAAFNIAKSPLELAGAPLAAVGKLATKAGIPGVENALAPFSTILRGDKVLKAYYEPGSQGDRLATIVDAMVRAGGRAHADKFYQTSVAKRAADNIRQLKEAIRDKDFVGVGGNAAAAALRAPFAIAEQFARPIMEYIVPRQKLGVFADLAQFELDRLGVHSSNENGLVIPKGVTDEQIERALARAWDAVDDRLGQLVYDNLFWNKTFKDIAMASVRSVGWNVGSVRAIVGGAGDTLVNLGRLAGNGAGGNFDAPEFTVRMSYILAIPIMAALVAAILRYLYRGHAMPDEPLPGALWATETYFPWTGKRAANGRKERLSAPGYLKDAVHYFKEPVKTAQGKLHPLLTTVLEMLENRDWRDRPITHQGDSLVQKLEDLFSHAAEAWKPMAIKSFEQEQDRGHDWQESLPAFVGVSPAPSIIDQLPPKRPTRHGQQPHTRGWR